jgi:hypothetical protein
MITFWFNQSAVIRLQCISGEIILEYISHGIVPKDLQMLSPDHRPLYPLSIELMVQARPGALKILKAGLDHALDLSGCSAHTRLSHMRQLRDASKSVEN